MLPSIQAEQLMLLQACADGFMGDDQSFGYGRA